MVEIKTQDKIVWGAKQLSSKESENKPKYPGFAPQPGKKRFLPAANALAYC